MTIKVEREALLRVLEHNPLSSSTSSLDESYCIARGAQSPSSSYDDDCSISTSSTLPFSDISDDEEESRTPRVSFASELVSDVFTRPRTQLEDIPDLYYSTDQIATFRQEYRLERKLLNELSLDYSSVDEQELSELVACSQNAPKHTISRVVVVHNDKLETFITPAQDDVNAFFDNDSFWSGSITWY